MKKRTKKKIKEAVNDEVVTSTIVQEVSQEAPKDKYKATIKVLGKIYEANGTTISEAISNLKPTNCKGRGILTIQHGEIKKDRILTNVATFRLFNTQGLTREIALKQISSLFQGI